MDKMFFVYFKIFLLLFWIFLNLPVLVLIKHVSFLSAFYNRVYFKVACFILGIKTKVVGGSFVRKSNLLLLSNHISYFDIFALGSVFKINFVAKSDVAKWPIFGIVSRLGNTVFISRSKTSAGSAVFNLEKEILKRKIPLLIFPEGTSSNGLEVLPFKSSLFSLFEDYMKSGKESPIKIQPISIAYTHYKNRRLSDNDVGNYAWYIKEQNLVDHLKNALKFTPFTMEVVIHKPVDISKFKDRKELACFCNNIVKDGFNTLTCKK